MERLRLEVKIEQEEGRGSWERLEECLERCRVLEEQLGRGEVPAPRQQVEQLEEDNRTFEKLYEQLEEEYSLLVGEVEQWKQLAQDRRRSKDLSSLMAKMEVREGEVADLRVEHASREEEKTYSTYSWT